MTELAIDNDVLIKSSAYLVGAGLLHHCCDEGCSEDNIVLVAARWVCEKRLNDRIAAGEAPTAAIAYFQDWLERMRAVEPIEEDLVVAAEIELTAQQNDFELDPGEAILAAICARTGGTLVTGDKRAIRALEMMLPLVTRLEGLRERVACLEQAIVTLVNHLGGPLVRGQVCGAPRIDVALTTSMECGRPAGRFSLDGSASYIAALRRTAPSMLHPGLALCASDS